MGRHRRVIAYYAERTCGMPELNSRTNTYVIRDSPRHVSLLDGHWTAWQREPNVCS